MSNRQTGHGASLATLAGIASLASILFGAAPALAADNQQALFAGYVNSPSYRAILQKAYNDHEPAPLKAKCSALKIVSFDKPEVVEAVQFAGGPGSWRMTSGAWVARATLDACGTQVIRRTLVESSSNNTLRTLPLLPGEFAGGFRLEESARTYVIESMQNVTACKDWKSPAVLDIKLKTPAGPKGWTELWTAQICGKETTARVDYVPDPTSSTGFSVVTKEIKVR
jgi:hypothetical protein